MNVLLDIEIPRHKRLISALPYYQLQAILTEARSLIKKGFIVIWPKKNPVVLPALPLVFKHWVRFLERWLSLTQD